MSIRLVHRAARRCPLRTREANRKKLDETQKKDATD
jgi:hypothetical protein